MSVDESTSIFLRYSIILLRSVRSTSTPNNLDLSRLRRVYLLCFRRRQPGLARHCLWLTTTIAIKNPDGALIFLAQKDLLL